MPFAQRLYFIFSSLFVSRFFPALCAALDLLDNNPSKWCSKRTRDKFIFKHENVHLTISKPLIVRVIRFQVPL